MTILNGVSPKIASYIGINYRIDFEKNRAFYYSISDGTVQECSIEFPPCSMRAAIAVFNEKAIGWLLKEGYVPRLDGKVVVFDPSLKESQLTALESAFSRD